MTPELGEPAGGFLRGRGLQALIPAFNRGLAHLEAGSIRVRRVSRSGAE
jgi:hypothetical protein